MKINYLWLILTLLLITGCSSVKINRKEKISRYFVMAEAIDSRFGYESDITDGC